MEPVYVNPCQPSPCGPNAQCHEVNQQAVCSCLPEFIGSPPACRPECTVNSECPLTQACINRKCADPCPSTCGQNADCRVYNHNPICSCKVSYTGDAFTRCYPIPQPIADVTPQPPSNPCNPSPCGQYAQCHNRNGGPVCSCLPSYIGSPPNCRPECVVNSDCPSNRACINEKCRDPCPGSCGFNAICNVLNHVPNCVCPTGYVGDPFSNCQPEPPRPVQREPIKQDPCVPSPCGANAACSGEGMCTCLTEYHGDPYSGCRPECVLNSDCARDRACINQKCKDPCPGTCGSLALCNVINHVPMCSCPAGMTGNAFVYCDSIPSNKEINAFNRSMQTHILPISVVEPPPPINPCQPSPCGSNAQCRASNQQAICSCLPGYIGAPPSCRPECVSNSECALDKYCLNQRCQDPCAGTCGLRAVCHVQNHSPICACPPRYTGDPFISCQPISTKRSHFTLTNFQLNIFKPITVIPKPTPISDVTPTNPCHPSPCGPNSECTATANGAQCTCLRDFVGTAPHCRPECVTSAECASDRACLNRKCADPCPGSCGVAAECRVLAHSAMCYCPSGYTGDPFSTCVKQQEPPTEVALPCSPSPCGPNAICQPRNGISVCQCLPDYFGNPYEACRPECVRNSDCSADKACRNHKCRDPCPGTCGSQATCQVVNHIPNCACLPGYRGDPYTHCEIVQAERKKFLMCILYS